MPHPYEGVMRNQTSIHAVICAGLVLAVTVIVDGQQRGHDVAAEVLAFERDIEAAVVRGDVPFVDAATAPTFTFTHGDGWTTGGAPLRVDTRADWMATVAKAPYASRVLDSVKTEVHGDIVITYGRYVGRFKEAAPGRRTFTVWYERVYAKRNGKWQYLSHRTVDGPIYEKEDH